MITAVVSTRSSGTNIRSTRSSAKASAPTAGRARRTRPQGGGPVRRSARRPCSRPGGASDSAVAAPPPQSAVEQLPGRALDLLLAEQDEVRGGAERDEAVAAGDAGQPSAEAR